VSALEKVTRIGEMAANIARDPMLGEVLALKGGTAFVASLKEWVMRLARGVLAAMSANVLGRCDCLFTPSLSPAVPSRKADPACPSLARSVSFSITSRDQQKE